MEDLPQEEGELSLKCLNMFHSTRYTGKHTNIGQYFNICLKALSPRNKCGHMPFMCLAMCVLSGLCEVFFFFFLNLIMFPHWSHLITCLLK